eukprot:11014627-Lingulodinium_polyedra.AAC.1
MARQGRQTWQAFELGHRPRAIRCHFDGGVDNQGSTAGWVLETAEYLNPGQKEVWTERFRIAKKLADGATIVECELLWAWWSPLGETNVGAVPRARFELETVAGAGVLAQPRAKPNQTSPS